MQIVYMQSAYIDYLRKIDPRVMKNKDEGAGGRPYLGVLFNIKGRKYFAPLTSSGKGKKLIDAPKKENITFYPLDNCRLGGVNINNMIPVANSVYKEVEYEITENDNNYMRVKKNKLVEQRNFINVHASHIKRKAIYLFNLKTQNRLYPNYDHVTCDFTKLEQAAQSYNAQSVAYIEIVQRIAEKLNITVEQVLKNNELFTSLKNLSQVAEQSDVQTKKQSNTQKSKTQNENPITLAPNKKRRDGDFSSK